MPSIPGFYLSSFLWTGVCRVAKCSPSDWSSQKEAIRALIALALSDEEIKKKWIEKVKREKEVEETP
jgi:hypothetical protein